jgi:DNA (cytosine-5)-methyltransferase 1
VILVENVREMLGWGPLLEDGTPCPDRIGRSFNQWVGRLRGLGYRVQWRELCAADYGAPTIRTRLVVQARCDDHPIVWPAPTHSKNPSLFAANGWRSAAECIDWSIPCPSIFERKRPLADATLKRIAQGIHKYVLGVPDPFIIGGRSAVLAGCGGRAAQSQPRPLTAPMGTMTTKADQILVSAYLAQHNLDAVGRDARKPMATITTSGTQIQLVEATLSDADRAGAERVAAFLIHFFSNGKQGQSLREPLGAVTTHDRYALVTVNGVPRPIVDIGIRMLTWRELAKAQSFPDDYDLTDGGRLSKTKTVHLIGNSVCPAFAKAIVGAAFGPHNQQQKEAA